MALANYSDLKASIAAWAHRSDLTTLMDDFIEMTEAEFYAPSIQGLEPLAVRELEELDTSITSGTGDRYTTLPTDFVQIRSIKLDTTVNDNGRLRYMAPDEMHIVDGSGQPLYYTITDQIEFDRTPDSDYGMEIRYTKKVAALTSGNTTNDILTNYPNIYLYGCLHQAMLYANDEQEALKYQNKFVNAIRGANKQTKAGRYGASPAMRGKGDNP